MYHTFIPSTIQTTKTIEIKIISALPTPLGTRRTEKSATRTPASFPHVSKSTSELGYFIYGSWPAADVGTP